MAAKPAAKKRKGDVKEDISALQFGDDFAPDAGVEALLNAEVKVRALSSACDFSRRAFVSAAAAT